MSSPFSTVSAMAAGGRFPHAVVIVGEKGTGRRTLALKTAQLILCDSFTSGASCGVCRSCELFSGGCSPDFVTAEQSGKRMIVPVAEVRRICADAYIKPNTSQRKVYLFADCDGIEAPAQNALLKLLEEPPEFVYFIFTALSRSVFLPTVLSRSVCIDVSELSGSECIKLLSKKGYSDEKAAAACSRFGGNIGKCIDWLENGELVQIAEITGQLTKCIRCRQEYDFLVALTGIQNDPRLLSRVLSELAAAARDCCAIRAESERLVSCVKSEAAALSEVITTAKAEKIYRSICETLSLLKMNVNPKLAITALSGNIF